MTYDTVALKALASLSTLYYAVGTSKAPVSASGVVTAAEGKAWESGRVYAQASGQRNAELVKASGATWVCVVSPQTPSTVEPHGLSSVVLSADGYVWRRLVASSLAEQKFSWYNGVVVPAVGWAGCYTHAGGDNASFSSPRVIEGSQDALVALTGGVVRPYVKTGRVAQNRVVVADGVYPGVGATASASLASGQLSAVTPTSNGTGYTHARVVVVGDGVGAEVTANLAGGEVVGYTVVSAGSGYSRAEVVVVAGERAGVWEAVTAPLVASLAGVKTLVTTDVMEVPAGVSAQLMADTVPLGAPTPLASGVAAKINTVITPE